MGARERIREAGRTSVRLAAVATVAAVGGLSTAPTAQALLSVSIVRSENAAGHGALTCPTLSRALSGGFSGELAGEVTGNFPYSSSAQAWNVLVNGFQQPSAGTTYGVCAFGDATLTVERAQLQFGYIPDFETRASATCLNPLAHVVGGGFQQVSASNVVPVIDSYPSGPRTWTVRTDAPSLRDIPVGNAFALCSLLALDATIRSGADTVSCGSSSQVHVLGGGWSGGRATASFPSGARSWTSAVPVAWSQAPALTYAVCGT